MISKITNISPQAMIAKYIIWDDYGPLLPSDTKYNKYQIIIRTMVNTVKCCDYYLCIVSQLMNHI